MAIQLVSNSAKTLIQVNNTGSIIEVLSLMEG